MRNKVAKALRLKARKRTVNRPSVVYSKRLGTNNWTREPITLGWCTRSVHKELKREYKA